jgi:hypothetical protein
MNEAVEAVRARAIALLEENGELGVATDALTYARSAKPGVLVAIARWRYSVVLAIDAAEYDGLRLADLIDKCA